MDEPSRESQKVERLRKIVAGGPWRFILLRGVIGWGLLTAVLFAFVMPLVDESSQTFFDRLPLALVIFPSGGVLWGAMMWYYFKRRWQGVMDGECR